MASEESKSKMREVGDRYPLYRVSTTGASVDIVEHYMMNETRGVLLPSSNIFVDKLLSGEFESRPDDIWIASYPKTGTTWASEVVAQLIANGDDQKAKALMAEMADKELERIEILPTTVKNIEQERIDYLRTFNSPGPRLIITHLPCENIPEHVFKVAKVIIPMRNPKDTCVSYMYFHRSTPDFGKYSGCWDDFLEAFVSGKIVYGDFYSFYKTFWARHKDNPNVHFMHYEEMLADREAAIKQISDFLGPPYSPISDDLLQTIVERTSFKKMKKEVGPWFDKWIDQKISPFFRKGIKGDWRNHFTVAQNEAFDRHHEAKMADMSDLKFIQ